MKITMYELLGMVKDGKAPKRIKYTSYEYSWHGKEYGYCRSVILSNWIALTTDFNLLEILNDEVEILEEEKKIPEKLMQLDTRETRECIIKIQDKINEICDYLKSKGE